jgi:hypothetical protein
MANRLICARVDATLPVMRNSVHLAAQGMAFLALPFAAPGVFVVSTRSQMIG